MDLKLLSIEFALETIGVIFLGARLGVLEDSEEGQRIMATTQSFAKSGALLVYLPISIAKHLPFYKKLVRDLQMLLDTFAKHINVTNYILYCRRPLNLI